MSLFPQLSRINTEDCLAMLCMVMLPFLTGPFLKKVTAIMLWQLYDLIIGKQ